MKEGLSEVLIADRLEMSVSNNPSFTLISVWSGEMLRFSLRLSTDWFYLTKQNRVFKNVCNHKDDLGVTGEFLNEEDTPGTREQTTRFPYLFFF